MVSSFYIRHILATRGPRAARYEVRASYRHAVTGSRAGYLNFLEEDTMCQMVKWLVDDYIECQRKAKQWQT